MPVNGFGIMVKNTATRLPIVIIGGFLGAGKTTLVNALLSEAEGKRLVVFVNDFGAINIDHALIETVAQDRISLKNGCVCCSLNEDLVAGIAEFAQSQNPPDAIVIEASGVADPRALDSTFNLLEASGYARVDTRVYILDGDGFDGLDYENSELIIDHAAAADLVLLNKSDIATDRKLQSLINLLEESAPYSTLVKTEHCAISLELVLSDHLAIPRKSKSHVRQVHKHNHDKKYAQWSSKSDDLIDRGKFLTFAKILPKHCLRAKGFLRFSDAPSELICFNLVGIRTSYEKLDYTEVLSSQLVAIGYREQIDDEFFTVSFKDMLIDS